MFVAGLDLSYTCTGIALGDGTPWRIVTPATMDNTRRRRVIRDQVLDMVAGSSTPGIIIVEDLPKTAKFSVAMLGMLHGVIRDALELAVDLGQLAAVVYVPPTCLKKYATGRGNAGKAEVLAEAIRRLDYQAADDNEADALWLRQMGLRQYQPEQATRVPATHDAGLNGIDWPILEELAT